MDPLQFLSEELKQGLLLTRKGEAQDFRRRVPFIATEPVVQAVPVGMPEVSSTSVPVSPGQLSLALSPTSSDLPPISDPVDFLNRELEYRQGLLFTRGGKPQNFRRGAPFVATDLIVPQPAIIPDVITETIPVSPGQLSLPFERPNAYRAGATIRATGPGLSDFPELRRFDQPVMQRPSVPRSRIPMGGALAGLALGLMDEEVARQIEANDPGAAAARVATNVVAGGAVGDVARNITAAALRNSPATAARVSRMAGLLAPVVLGAGLFLQGKEGSPFETIVRKVSEATPGMKPDPQTDVGKKAANEAQYILRSLLGGRIPYTR